MAAAAMRRAAALLGCALVLLSVAASAQAAWPGRDGSIAFVRGPQIWAQSPSGKQRQLTDGSEGADSEPTYSRDGRMIAFIRYAGGDSDLWVMKSDGTGERPVAGAAGDELQPAFFPGGHSLAFTGRSPSGWAVFSVKLDGSGRRLLAERAKNPAISPNGSLLAFAEYPGNQLRLKDLRSGDERQLPSGNAQEPDFSPDGGRLVFVGQRPCGTKPHRRLALLTIGLRARAPRILRRGCREGFLPYSPVWSPRGNRILFVRRDNPAGAAVSRLQLLNLHGALLGGAPRHRGAGEFSPSWQPLR